MFGILFQKMLLILVQFAYLGAQLARSTFPDFSVVLDVLHTFLSACVYFVQALVLAQYVLFSVLFLILCIFVNK